MMRNGRARRDVLALAGALGRICAAAALMLGSPAFAGPMTDAFADAPSDPARLARGDAIIVQPNGSAEGPLPAELRPTRPARPDDPWLPDRPMPVETTDLPTALALAEARATRTGSDAAPIRVLLLPGHHWLEPLPYLDPTCGNCEDPATSVPATLGARLTGRRIRLIGPEEGGAIVHTRAGYGLLVEDCTDCEVSGLVFTDGARDTSGSATDAAIVVRRSTVRITGNTIRDNIGDPSVIEAGVVGIIGIAGREGARLRIEGNRIHRNSWDGIALYRGAEAEIVDNDIDGVDLALGRTAGGGRGVGIGLTWDARALVRGNRVARYWKGIGVFVDAQAIVEENLVERIATWGLSLWDAEKGRPSARFRSNVVDSTGACGVSIVRSSGELPEPGELVGNVLARTGQNPKYDGGEPYCYQTAIALHAAPESFLIADNLMLENRESGGRRGGGDADLAAVLPTLSVLAARLAVYPSMAAGGFFARYGLGLGEGSSGGGHPAQERPGPQR